MRHLLYSSWHRVQVVCNSPNDKRYSRYGGRGIKCLWKTLDEFCEDMYPSFEEHLQQHGRLNTTIERIDNDGHYCKENCKWATRKEQARNRVSRREICYKGECRSTTEWGEKLGIPRYVIELRIDRRGWSIEEALNTPLLTKGHSLKENSGRFKNGHKPLNKGRNQFT